MTEEDPSTLAAAVTDAAVRGMVDALEPDWRVEAIERIPEGTEFVARLAVETPDGARSAVLKATTADLVDPRVARAEPRLLELVDRETTIPVPTVYGYCDDHDEFPAPFVLLSDENGENYEGEPTELPPAVRETVLREAGENLAALHDLGPLPASGTIGVRDGALAVLDTEEHPRYDDFRDNVLANCEETLDSLTEGGFFPDLADDPERFADLVPPVREYVRETIPALPEPDLPTYCHWDYRYGNVLLNPETGSANAVLDWANLAATDPAYNLAKAELSLLTPDEDSEERTETLRNIFRTAYAEARDDWSFDDAVRERMDAYRLTGRLDNMACLPLWYQDATPAERDERAAEHRAFVERYLS